MNRFIVACAASLLVLGGAMAQQPAPMPGTDKKGMEMKGMEMKGMEMKGMDTKGMDKKGMMDMKKMMPAANDPASTAGYKASMMKMMHAMPAFSGDADVDFMKQMRPHHQAAIDMAKVVLANGRDADTKKLAQDIIVAQEKEIAMIDAWLKKKG